MPIQWESITLNEGESLIEPREIYSSLNNRRWDRLRPDTVGLVLGAVFFVLALTPSLLPRDVLSQGAPCGLCAGTGYPLGVRLSWNWRT